jgi:hypothetical protein
MSHSTARHDPRAESRDEEVADLRVRRPEHQQGGKPRQPLVRPADDGGIGPDEPDDGEFEVIGEDDLSATDLGPAAPNFRDPDAGSGRARK